MPTLQSTDRMRPETFAVTGSAFAASMTPVAVRECATSATSVGVRSIGRHVHIHVIHDPKRAADHERHDQRAEGQRQGVVHVVGRGREMQEEYEMHANLRDGENGQRDRDAWPP